jgi:hypothetical protein
VWRIARGFMVNATVRGKKLPVTAIIPQFLVALV